MGEHAGELSRKYISFHCLQNESNVPKDRNTEGTENSPDLPQRRESEIVVIEETETSPRKSLAVLQVAGGRGAMIEKTEDTKKESLVVSGQECLLSSSDDRSEGLEKFLRDKLDSFSGEGLDRIVGVDPTVVLELLDENLANRGSTGSDVVAIDEEMPRSQVDDILCSGLQEKEIDSVSKRPLCDVDVGAADERPSKSVAFQLDNTGVRLSSGECELVGVSDAGQSFPTSCRPGDTDYGTSELESIARKRVDDVSGKRFRKAARLDLPGSSATTVQHGLGTGRSKYHPSESSRTLLKQCFADNRPVQLDPHQQLTGISSDQMIQFAKAIGFEVSLATFGMLEDVLLKIGGKTGRNVGDKGSGQSPSLSRRGPQLWRVLLHACFVRCPLLRNRSVLIPLLVIFRSNLVQADRLMQQ